MSTLMNYLTPAPADGAATKDFFESQSELKIVGESELISSLRTRLRRLGPHYRIALLRGEAGTGKELVARSLHGFSSHAAGPFVVLRVAEEEEKLGSLMQKAHRGTLYLDRIERATAEAQDELLDVLRSREGRRNGRIVVHGLEARVIASAAEDFRVLAAAGRFRQELYARLATVEIELPPLRERQGDIPLLAKHFLERHAGHHAHVTLTEKALERLKAYHWPGNVSELKKRLFRAAAESEGRIEAEAIDLSRPVPEPEGAATAVGSTRLQEVVEQHVFQVLRGCAGNKVKAAELLGISRSTLYRMLDAGLQADKMVGLR